MFALVLLLLCDGGPVQVVSRLADNALAAFAKVIVDVHNANSNGVLSQYTRHPSLRRRFNEGWAVQIGFGLHIGASRWHLCSASLMSLFIVQPCYVSRFVFR